MSGPDLRAFSIPQLEYDLRPGCVGVFNSRSLVDIVSATTTWGSKRVLLVNSTGLAASSTYVEQLKDRLGDLLVSVKQGVGSHSPYADVIDIAHRISDYDIDCICCVGSGSYSDACKAARLLVSSLPPGFGETDLECLMDSSLGVAPERLMTKNEAVKLILVPTSLSAGEWNYAASCTNKQGKKQHVKLIDGGAADLVLMDPWLAKSTPELLWLSSGFRAIDHCIETLCHEKCASHVDAQAWCIQALGNLVKGLSKYKSQLRTTTDAQDELVEGISRCQSGSRMALMSFMIYGIPMGASHAIGHQLGSSAQVMHGVTSCIILPHVLRQTEGVTSSSQKRILDVFNRSLDWNETNAADCVARLVRELELPCTLRSVGVTRDEQIEEIIDKTMTDVIASFGKFPSRAEISSIVNAAR